MLVQLPVLIFSAGLKIPSNATTFSFEMTSFLQVTAKKLTKQEVGGSLTAEKMVDIV